MLLTQTKKYNAWIFASRQQRHSCLTFNFICKWKTHFSFSVCVKAEHPDQSLLFSEPVSSQSKCPTCPWVNYLIRNGKYFISCPNFFLSLSKKVNCPLIWHLLGGRQPVYSTRVSCPQVFSVNLAERLLEVSSIQQFVEFISLFWVKSSLYKIMSYSR